MPKLLNYLKEINWEDAYYFWGTIASLLTLLTFVSIIIAIKTLKNLNRTLKFNKEDLELNRKQFELNTLALIESTRPYVIIYPIKPFHVCIKNLGNRDAQNISINYSFIEGLTREYFNQIPKSIFMLPPHQELKFDLNNYDFDENTNFKCKFTFKYFDSIGYEYNYEVVFDNNIVNLINHSS
jgi:hypothetical protein